MPILCVQTVGTHLSHMYICMQNLWIIDTYSLKSNTHLKIEVRLLFQAVIRGIKWETDEMSEISNGTKVDRKMLRFLRETIRGRTKLVI